MNIFLGSNYDWGMKPSTPGLIRDFMVERGGEVHEQYLPAIWSRKVTVTRLTLMRSYASRFT